MPAYSRYISLGAESTYGTAVTPTTRFDIAGESLELRKDIDFVPAVRFNSPRRTHSNRRRVQGSVDAFFGFEKLPVVLKHLFGSPETSGPLSDSYSHTFTATLEPTASLTLDVPREQSTHRYSGTCITQARLSIGAPEHWGLALSFLGKDEALTSVASINDSDLETPIWTLDTGHATPFTVTVVSGGTTWNATLTGLDFEIAWNRELRMSARSETPTGFITHGFVRCKGRLRWLYDGDSTFLYTAYTAQSDVSITINWYSSEISPGSGIYRRVRVLFPKCRITGKTPTVKAPGYDNIEHEIPFEALYEPTNEGPLEIMVTNTTANY